jgi:hypothetical protein
MPIDRTLWNRLFEPDEIPNLPCPTCKKGRLKSDKDDIIFREPTYSKLEAQHQDWEPDWQTKRFNTFLECDNKKCGEVVAITGDTEIVETFLEDATPEGIWALTEALRPRSMFPSPPLFPIPDSFPKAVAEQLRIAFQLYWSDFPSCISRIRTSLEIALDEKKVPRTRLRGQI